MRMISLLVLGAFWLVACDRSTEPKVSSPSGVASAQPMNQAAESKPEPNAASAPGADHAKPISPQDEPTLQELDTAMPLPGQATGEL
jgi:hypothetical protein